MHVSTAPSRRFIVVRPDPNLHNSGHFPVLFGSLFQYLSYLRTDVMTINGLFTWCADVLTRWSFCFSEILLKQCNISSYLRDRQLYDRPWNSNCHLVVLLWTVTPSLTNEAHYTVRGRHTKVNYAVTLAVMCLFYLAYSWLLYKYLQSSSDYFSIQH